MQVERLIECVKSRPVLYDHTHPKSMTNKYHIIAWREIADELNQPAPACKARWQKLRERFRNQWLKMKAMEQTADTPGRKYIYNDLLQFLIPHIQERPTLSSLDYVSTQECNNRATKKSEPLPPSSLPVSSPHNLKIEVVESQVTEKTKPPQKEEKPSSEKQEIALEKNMTDCRELLTHMVQEKADVETPRTPLQLFFDAMAASVSRLGRKYQSIAKRKIIEIVTDLEEMEDDDNDYNESSGPLKYIKID